MMEHSKIQPLQPDAEKEKRDANDYEMEHIVKEEPLDPSEDCTVVQDGCVVIKDEPDSSTPCDDCYSNIMDFEVPSEEGGGLISIQFDPCPDSIPRKAKFLTKKKNKERQKIIRDFREKLGTSPPKECQLETTRSGLLAAHSWEQRLGAFREKIVVPLDKTCNREPEKETNRVPPQGGPSGDYYKDIFRKGNGGKPSALVQCFYIEGRLVFPEESAPKATKKLPNKLQESSELISNLGTTVCDRHPSVTDRSPSENESKRKTKHNKNFANKRTKPKLNEKGLTTSPIKRSQRQLKKPRISFEELAVSEEELNDSDLVYESADEPSRKRGLHKQKHDFDQSQSRTPYERSYTQHTPKPHTAIWEYNPTTGMQKYRGIEVRPCFVKIPVMTKDFLASYGVDLGETEGCKIDLKTLKRGLFSCAHCKYRTHHKLELARHVTKHAKKDKPFKCPQCEYRAILQYQINQHIRCFHLKEKLFKCDKCDYGNSYSAGLQAHKIAKHNSNFNASCPHCDYRTKHARSLGLHLQTHTGERPFACPHCPYRARQYPHLKSHIYVHLNIKPYACTECNYRTRQKSHLNQHMKLMHSDEKPRKCEYCDFACKCSHTLLLHIRRHTGERPFACNMCPFRTAHSVLIKKHKIEHEEKKTHQCTYCTWSSDSLLPVENHVSQWHPEKCAHKCNKCNFKSTSQTRLYYHKQRKHKMLHTLRCPHCKYSDDKIGTFRHHVKNHKKKCYERELVDLKTLWRGMYACKFCKFRTNIKYQLSRHQPNHVKHENPYKCPKCEFRSKNSHSVGKHLKGYHNSEKKFKCAHCNHRTSLKASLRHHIMTHFDDRTICCPHCDYKCKTTAALRPHLISHTGERPYACPHCPYRANQVPHLKSHINFHLNLRPYACSICPFRARQTSHLNTHMKRIHCDEKPLKCDYCDFTCKGLHTLAHHKRTHTGEKPFSCELCAFRTGHPCLLNKHMRGHNENYVHQCPHCLWSTDILRAFKNHLSSWHPEKCAYKCDKCSYSTTTKIRLYYHGLRNHRY